jgi:hypothetical protein
MEIYLEVGRDVKPWERALQNGLWLAGTPCEAKVPYFEVRTVLPESRCITEESMPGVKDGKISGGYPFTNGNRNVGAYQIQGHEAF